MNANQTKIILVYIRILWYITFIKIAKGEIIVEKSTERELGNKLYIIKTNSACNIPLLYPAVALALIAFVVLPTNEVTANMEWIQWVVAAVCGLLVLYVILQMTYCHIMLHENAIVIVSLTGKKIIWRDDIAAIRWDKPGFYEGSTRGVRKNTEIAEVMLHNGGMVKISTGAYTGVPQQLGSWQSDYRIPQEL